ncbi:MAG: DUF3137 domain-containing protein [Antricoccus sp.]
MFGARSSAALGLGSTGSSSFSWLYPVVFVIIAILVVWRSTVNGQKRRERISRFAASRGLTYEQRNDAWTRMDWGSPFGEGSSRKASNVLTGHLKGRPVVTFDYQFTTGSGDDQTTHNYVITAAQIPRAFPKLVVDPESASGRMARRLGFKDIELESETFNKQYKIKCDNRKFAYDVLHPRFMEWMLQTNSAGFTIAGPYVVIARYGALTESALDNDFAYISTVIDHMPNFVWAN